MCTKSRVNKISHDLLVLINEVRQLKTEILDTDDNNLIDVDCDNVSAYIKLLEEQVQTGE